ncbi:aldehyde oxidase and xanthine dehydrogenase molybdopterin binding [Proteiniborus sp. DW1]|uniref:xanthine dehydrogenase family protein molybdopterin-binding subunit n=1 Tax=Proteiniborus sp. DW1 TaxID=1889883 RepID=UPI00092E0976|nr:molybdopterin cofactor-binding domain-containing protein [Proteiniborus sp. DW1]SCG81990.1 aldehyde oxidase and xanthine dehydrogenase molybdopterin binding [Proteiniborus sp. DW1]
MKKRGVGVGCMWYGIGNTGLPNPAAAFVEVHGDGSVTALVGCADIGQGSSTVMAQIVAETLGVNYEDVNVTAADTGVTPEGGATSASRQTYISGNACLAAAKMAKKTLIEVAAEVLGVDEELVNIKNKKVIVTNDESKQMDFSVLMDEMKKRGKIALGSGSFNPDTTALDPVNMQGIPYACYAYATNIVEVEVDTETGEVQVLKVVAAHDVGQTINEKMAEGQIEGGAAMGMGLALLEKVEVEKGVIKNPGFSKYLVYTAADMPEIYPILVEDPTLTGPYGAKGLGEPALIPVIPAILNAIYDAIGVRFTEVPVTPEAIIEALKNKN